MFKDKKSVYIIAFSLIALLTMQGMWLFYAIKQEKRFLGANTRQAALESLAILEQKEDSKFLFTSLDTLLTSGLAKKVDVIPGSKNVIKRSEVKVIMNSGQQVFVHKTDGHNVTTNVMAMAGNADEPHTVKIVETYSKTDNKAGAKETAKLKNYERLLKKIVHQSQPHNLKIEERVNFTELTKTILKNLATRGIDIRPEMAVIDKKGQAAFKTKGYTPGRAIIIPMFTKDIVAQGYSLHLFYPSTMNYIFKRAISVIVLSLFVTSLLIAVILMLFKRMLTEQKLNQYKNDFINNLTHELKTPLATISLANSNINAAASYSAQDNIKQYTTIIEEENKKLNHHIEKVFELSRLEKEKQIFNTEIFDVHEIITEFIFQNKKHFDSGNINLTTHLTARHSKVKADRFHLNNVLSNLVDNAVKYNEGLIRIEIRTTNTGDRILISVKDNGIGISKEHQRFIFDKFFRVTKKDLHTTKGFGVGLSYVKQTVELFGGSVSVNSELNNGSEFIIALPYAKN